MASLSRSPRSEQRSPLPGEQTPPGGRPASRVLVTGAAGFTGRHLCALLEARGHTVIRLVERPSGASGEVVADLADRATVAAAVRAAAPDAVVHLAAIAFPAHADADAIYRVNVGGTLALLEALAAGGFARDGVLLPSTATVYAGNAPEAATGLGEDSPVAPASHYAVSKLAMEHMARIFARALPIVLVRPFNYTGPGQREPYLVPKIVRHFAQRAQVIELGNTHVERDFLDVRTVVDAYVRLLATAAARGGTFNLCSGSGQTVSGLVERLEALTGHRIEVRVNPQFVRAGEPQRIVGSNARLVAAIGPLAGVPLDTTLRDMLAAAQG